MGVADDMGESHQKVSPPHGEAQAKATIFVPAAIQSLPEVELLPSGDDTSLKSGEAGVSCQPWPCGRKVADSFEIHDVIGQGANGIVYLGSDIVNERPVAIKMPAVAPRIFLSHVQLRGEVVREARAWASLVHPNIVRVLQIRCDASTDQLPAIIMDFCDGGNLRALLEDYGRLPVSMALDIAIQVAWAMAYAHERGLLHCDLKPENILRTSEGLALVGDFGLARAYRGSAAAEFAKTPRLFGTPVYLPPEQWEGQVFPQSDIYAFGAMLWELISGSPPFAASELDALKALHLRGALPDLGALGSGSSKPLAALLHACLAKTPNQRPPGFTAVAEELQTLYRQFAGIPHHEVRTKPWDNPPGSSERCATGWALLRLGNAAQRWGDPSLAKQNLEAALAVFRQAGSANGTAQCLLSMATAQCGNDDESALKLWREVEGLASREPYMLPILEVALRAQMAIRLDQGAGEEAIRVSRRHQDVCATLGAWEQAERNLGWQASFLASKGKRDRALSKLGQQQALCRRYRNFRGLLWSLGAEMRLRHAMHDPAGALRSAKQHEALCRRLDATDALRWNLGIQGLILAALGEYGEARAILEEQQSRCGNDSRLVQQNLLRLAVVCQKEDRLDDALAILAKQQEMCTQPGLAYDLQASLSMQSAILIKQKRWEEAAFALQRQMEVCTKEDYAGVLLHALPIYARVLHTLHRDEDALRVLSTHRARCCEPVATDMLQQALGRQAAILRRKGKCDRALETLSRRAEICKRYHNTEGLSRCLGQRAEILRANGDSNGAADQYREIVRLATSMGARDKAQWAKSRLALGLAPLEELPDTPCDTTNARHADSPVAAGASGTENARWYFSRLRLGEICGDELLQQIDRQEDPVATALPSFAAQPAAPATQQEEAHEDGGDDMELLQRSGEKYLGAANYTAYVECLRRQATLWAKWRRVEDSMQCLTEAERVCRQQKWHDHWVNILLQRAGLCQAFGHADDAQRALEEACGMSRSLPNPNYLIGCLDTLAAFYETHGLVDKAFKTTKDMEMACCQPRNRQGLLLNLGLQAVIYASRGGNSTRAMELLEEQEKLCIALDDREALLSNLGEQAKILCRWRGYKTALTRLWRQERLCHSAERWDAMAFCLRTQAAAWEGLREWKKAIVCLDREADLYTKTIHSPAGSQRNLANRAGIFRALGHLDKAMAALVAQEGICRAHTDLADALQRCLHDQAAILKEQGNFPGAMTRLQEQEKICRDTHNVTGLSENLKAQVNILRSWKDLDAAERVLHEHRTVQNMLSEKLRRRGLSWNKGKLASVCAARGGQANLKQALELLREAEELSKEDGYLQGVQWSVSKQAGIAEQMDEGDQVLARLLELEREWKNRDAYECLQMNLCSQASMARAKRDYEAASRLLKEQYACVSRGQENGRPDKMGLQRGLELQAAVCGDQGKWQDAIALLRKRKEVLIELRLVEELAECWEEMAQAAAATGDMRNAKKYASEAIALRRRMGIPIDQRHASWGGK